MSHGDEKPSCGRGWGGSGACRSDSCEHSLRSASERKLVSLTCCILLLIGAATAVGFGHWAPVFEYVRHAGLSPGEQAPVHGRQLRGVKREGSPPQRSMTLPPDFDWRAYKKWNPFLAEATKEAAEQHYLQFGHKQDLVYKDFTLILRYTACGGLMNQHYSHLAALALARLSHAQVVVWPPMQERQSFSKRFHPDPSLNRQTWSYLDAETVWDLPRIQRKMRDRYDIEVIKHPPDAPLPDMTRPEFAFQAYNLSGVKYSSHLRLQKPIYIGRNSPKTLARTIMDAGRQVVLRTGRQPSSVLLDLPCTLFMLDHRNFPLVEDMAKLLNFSPVIQKLARKVIGGIKARGAKYFNGLHLRMEKDAIDWQNILGGHDTYWLKYKDAMAAAQLNSQTPLYVASGLLTAKDDRKWAKAEMKRLTADILTEKFASKVVHKEMYLTAKELASVGVEQAALIDLLVLRNTNKLVGIGVSTFSFYLYEQRLLDGKAPADTQLLMASAIGTDELFFSAGLVAVRTRNKHHVSGTLPDLCRQPGGGPCFQ